MSPCLWKIPKTIRLNHSMNLSKDKIGKEIIIKT